MKGLKVLGVLGGFHMTPAKVAGWIESADLVIAADSGLLRVLEAGFIPDVVLGDFDSVSEDLIDESTVRIIEKNQDFTDCSKLLTYAEGQGAERVTLICAEGDLTDHFLDTIHSAVRATVPVSIGLERGIAHILKGPANHSFAANSGARTSLLPLETLSNVTLQGVEWPLENVELSVRGRTSISNKVVNSHVEVTFSDGSAYLFIENEYPSWH